MYYVFISEIINFKTIKVYNSVNAFNNINTIELHMLEKGVQK